MKFQFDKPKILSQHVDTLVATFKSVDEHEYNKYIIKTLSMLEDFKIDAQNVEGFSNKSRFCKCEPFDGFGTFKVFAQGMGAYRYILENQDVMIFLSNAKFGTDMPQIKVEFRAHYLFAVGQNKAYEYVLKLIDVLLGCKYESSIQRLDLATDIWGVKLEYLDAMRFQNSFKNSNYRQGSKQTGISFGGGSFMFRIYDKLIEIKNSHSKHYVKTKWIVNGYDEALNYNVTRFEAQFRRTELKKYIPQHTSNEIAYVFNHLGNFWIKALQKIKYAPLTNDECLRIADGTLKADSKRQIFNRARKNEDRFQFQKFLYHWDNSISDFPIEYKTIQAPKIEVAKRMLKGFIATAYKAVDGNPRALTDVLIGMQTDMYKFEQKTLHDYGLSKIIDSFIKQEKMKNKVGVQVDFDYSLIAHDAYFKLAESLGSIDAINKFIPSINQSESIEDYFPKTYEKVS
ncbi:hypothetical protein [Sulfurimonas sp. NWX367]|uniref:hypothetical protein n=1 Tax=Sulfurimonas sp. NWX367 TaxID=2925413 RepID=UPI0032049F68